jgi:hypothetical protein
VNLDLESVVEVEVEKEGTGASDGKPFINGKLPQTITVARPVGAVPAFGD